MEENFNKLVKQIRFYVCIISGIAMIAFMSYSNKYKVEYNRVEAEYRHHQQEGTDYKYIDSDGNPCTATVFTEIYKGQIESIVASQMGRDFVYKTRSDAGGNAFLCSIPFIISLIMCIRTLSKGTMPKIDYNKAGNAILITVGAVGAVFILIVFANAVTTTMSKPSASERYYSEHQDSIDNYKERQQNKWTGYKGTKRNSFGEDEALKKDGYDPKEYRNQHGY